MAAPGRNPSVDVLRDAVRRAQEDGVSLASLGKAIGLSAAGVLKFLRGSDPRPSTVKKLGTWYTSRPPLEDGPVLATVQPTFDSFFPGLPDDERTRLLRSLRDQAAAAYHKRGTAPARWITELGGPE